MKIIRYLYGKHQQTLEKIPVYHFILLACCKIEEWPRDNSYCTFVTLLKALAVLS